MAWSIAARSPTGRGARLSGSRFAYRMGPIALVEDGDYHVRPGFIDIVPPRMIHAEFAGPARTVAVIVRSEKVGGFMQGRFDPATGAASEAPGPEQLPYPIAGRAR